MTMGLSHEEFSKKKTRKPSAHSCLAKPSEEEEEEKEEEEKH